MFSFQVCLSQCRWKIWCFVEDPRSSHGAKLFAFRSVLFVFISVSGEGTRDDDGHGERGLFSRLSRHLGLVLGSMPEFKIIYKYTPTTTDFNISDATVASGELGTYRITSINSPGE